MNYEMKPSYASALSANASSFPPPPEPSPLFPPIAEPRPSSRYGSFKIEYDRIIGHAFNAVPLNPTLIWSMYRSIYIEHPERIRVVSSPHQNNPKDLLHISVRIVVNETNNWEHAIHIYGRINGTGMGCGEPAWFNSHMTSTSKVGDVVVNETIAIWDKSYAN